MVKLKRWIDGWNLTNLSNGLQAGLISGLLFGVLLLKIGAMEYNANLLGVQGMQGIVIGFILHLMISGVLGALFAGIFYYQTISFLSSILYGAGYAFLIWIIGPVLLLSLIQNQAPLWNTPYMVEAIILLIGYLIYGLTLGDLYFWLEENPHKIKKTINKWIRKLTKNKKRNNRSSLFHLKKKVMKFYSFLIK